MNTKDANMSDEIDGKSFGDTIIDILSYILAVPAFFILHRLLPDPNWMWNSDRILLAIAAVLIMGGILHSFKVIVLGAVLVLTGWLSYESIWGDYGFNAFYTDYKSVIYAMAKPPKAEVIKDGTLEPFPYQAEFDAALGAIDTNVIRFARLATIKHFKDVVDHIPENRKLIQYLAVFKEVNQWNYVNDPSGREYFAPASESVETLSGDCDDHSILMAAAIEAIGGTVRLVLTTDHIYPELLLEDKAQLERANILIRNVLFSEESAGKDLHYHQDEDGRIWLNLDYTGDYPGARFMSEEIISVYYPED